MCRLTTVDSRQRSWRRDRSDHRRDRTGAVSRSRSRRESRREVRATSCGGGRAATRLARCRPGNRVRKRSQEPSASGPESLQRPARNTSSNRRNAMRSRITFMMFGPIDRRDRIVHGVPSRPAIHRTYAALASESDDLSPGRVGSPPGVSASRRREVRREDSAAPGPGPRRA